ncbi:MAG: hypothetical protein NT078_00640, partial [Candidatus Azambacteria bacterium]|nr:hypothetical protein [Candidatus Azambacteria bacterium]
IGKGILNGAERIAGTSTLGLVGKYDRDFGVNGPIAKNKFASDFVGWGGPFFVYVTASGVGNSLFGVANRQWGWAATGAMVGVGVGAADTLLDK